MEPSPDFPTPYPGKRKYARVNSCCRNEKQNKPEALNQLKVNSCRRRKQESVSGGIVDKMKISVKEKPIIRRQNPVRRSATAAKLIKFESNQAGTSETKSKRQLLSMSFQGSSHNTNSKDSTLIRKPVAKVPQTPKALKNRKFNVLKSSSYWLAQIKLAESVEMHLISLGFFRLAMESKPNRLQCLRNELKAYATKYHLLEFGEVAEEILQMYGILEEIIHIEVGKPLEVQIGTSIMHKSIKDNANEAAEIQRSPKSSTPSCKLSATASGDNESVSCTTEKVFTKINDITEQVKPESTDDASKGEDISGRRRSQRISKRRSKSAALVEKECQMSIKISSGEAMSSNLISDASLDSLTNNSAIASEMEGTLHVSSVIEKSDGNYTISATEAKELCVPLKCEVSSNLSTNENEEVPSQKSRTEGEKYCHNITKKEGTPILAEGEEKDQNELFTMDGKASINEDNLLNKSQSIQYSFSSIPERTSSQERPCRTSKSTVMVVGEVEESTKKSPNSWVGNSCELSDKFEPGTLETSQEKGDDQLKRSSDQSCLNNSEVATTQVLEKTKETRNEVSTVLNSEILLSKFHSLSEVSDSETDYANMSADTLKDRLISLMTSGVESQPDPPTYRPPATLKGDDAQETIKLAIAVRNRVSEVLRKEETEQVKHNFPVTDSLAKEISESSSTEGLASDKTEATTESMESNIDEIGNNVTVPMSMEHIQLESESAKSLLKRRPRQVASPVESCPETLGNQEENSPIKSCTPMGRISQDKEGAEKDILDVPSNVPEMGNNGTVQMSMEHIQLKSENTKSLPKGRARKVASIVVRSPGTLANEEKENTPINSCRSMRRRSQDKGSTEKYILDVSSNVADIANNGSVQMSMEQIQLESDNAKILLKGKARKVASTAVRSPEILANQEKENTPIKSCRPTGRRSQDKASTEKDISDVSGSSRHPMKMRARTRS